MTSIFIVSGGTGFSGEQLLRTVLAQFPVAAVEISVIPGVRRPEQLESVVERAQLAGGLIAHTLVDDELRLTLERLARSHGVLAVDLIGPLLAQLQVVLGTDPIGQPGLYREQNREALERTEAIDYTLAHDDGCHPEGWRQANIVLVGVSRVGKTPIWQHLKDIERCYPSSGIGGWVSSSGLRLVFSVQDNETLRYFATGTGEAMTETDIRQLPPGKILCMMDGENPLLVDRAPGPV